MGDKKEQKYDGIIFGYSEEELKTLKWLKETAYQFEYYTILPDEKSD